MKKTILLGLLLLSFATLNSCDETDDIVDGISSEQAMMRATAMIFFANEADFETGTEVATEFASMRVSGGLTPAAICGTVTLVSEGIGFPKVINIDYGDGCTDDKGITRRGSLTVTLTAFVLQNGAQMIIERNNYYIDDYRVEGTVTHTNTSASIFNPQWTVEMPNGQITTPEGEIYTHSGSRTMRQIGGVDSEVLLDNVFEITGGSHTVVDAEGDTLEANVVANLRKRYNCSYITEGRINLQANWLDGDLDFGAGSCDDDAIYTHDPTGQTYEVDLN